MDQPTPPDDRAPDPPSSARRGRGGGAPSAVQTLLAFGVLIALVVVFSIASPNFLQFDNIVGILLATAVNGVLALGVTFVIISGGIDLSIGTVMSLSAVMTGVVVTNWQLPVPRGIVAGLATGAAAGMVNGFVIARLRLPPFIATLGMLKVANGLALITSGLRPIYFTDTPSFNEIAMGSIVAKLIPSLEIPNLVLFLFGAAVTQFSQQRCDNLHVGEDRRELHHPTQVLLAEATPVLSLQLFARGGHDLGAVLCTPPFKHLRADAVADLPVERYERSPRWAKS